MEFAIGFLAGLIVCGVIAHNKPEWFNKMVRKAADVENKVQDSLNKK